MAANKITNTLIANITAQEDSSQNIVINRGTGNPNFDSVVAQMTEYYILANGNNDIALPATTCYQLYVRNNDPALIITPKITPKGGVVEMSFTQLYPGDQLIIWQANNGVNAGFTAFSLVASGAGALVEFFIGA
jgi:hypothetical protein